MNFSTAEARKRFLLAVAAVGLTLGVLLVVIRAVPALDDLVSGSPHYVQTITESVARRFAQNTGNEYPIIVMREDSGAGCEGVTQKNPSENLDSVYVFAYDEAKRTMCLSVFVIVSGRAGTEFDPANGEQYGKQLQSKVRVVPVERQQTTFDPVYLRQLHWRTTPSPSNAVANTRRQSGPSGAIAFADVEVNFLEMRRFVAARHRRVNTILTSLVVGSLACSLLAMGLLIGVYRATASELQQFGRSLPLQEFFRSNLATTGRDARIAYQAKREREFAETRSEHIARKHKEELVSRLQALASSIKDSTIENRITATLERADVDEMQSMISTLQQQTVIKTPDERLEHLLEPLKDLVLSPEIFWVYRERAFSILSESGFREARDFVVSAHKELRVQAREEEVDQRSQDETN